MYHIVYILESLNDGGYYVGITSNLEKRLAYHNKGYVRSTKSRIPFKVVYKEIHPSRLQAREREKYLKSYKGAKEKFSLLGK